MRKSMLGAVLGFALVLSVRLPAQTAESLAGGLSLFGSSRFIAMQVQMNLALKGGTKSRTLDVFIHQEVSRVSVLIHVISPGFLSSMKFLAQRDANGQESTWMKTSEGVKRLTDASNAERVFDSDFRAEDFMAISPRRFQLSLLPDVEIDSIPCRAVRARPLAPAGYASKLVYVGAEDKSLRGIDYLDTEGKLIRQYRLISTQVLEGGTYPLTAEMMDVREGTSTTLKVTSTDLRTPLPDSLFNKGSL